MATMHNGRGFDDCAECQAILKSLAVELSIPVRDLAAGIAGRAGGGGSINVTGHLTPGYMAGTKATMPVIGRAGSDDAGGNAKPETGIEPTHIERGVCLWCGYLMTGNANMPEGHATWCVHYRRPPRPSLVGTGFHWNDEGGVDHD